MYLAFHEPDDILIIIRSVTGYNELWHTKTNRKAFSCFFVVSFEFVFCHI